MIIMKIPADRSIKDSWGFVTAENLVTEIVQLLKIEGASLILLYLIHNKSINSSNKSIENVKVCGEKQNKRRVY